jgi:hypothetical protein
MDECEDDPFSIGNPIAREGDSILISIQAIAVHARIDRLADKIAEQLLFADKDPK